MFTFARLRAASEIVDRHLLAAFTITSPATIQLMPRSLPEDVARMLAHHLEPGSVARVARTWRSWRWMIDRPEDRIVWIAEDDEGWPAYGAKEN